MGGNSSGFELKVGSQESALVGRYCKVVGLRLSDIRLWAGDFGAKGGSNNVCTVFFQYWGCGFKFRVLELLV